MTLIPKASGNPAKNALEHYLKVKYLEELVNYTEKELLALHGIGPKAVRILKEELKKLGLAFKSK